MEKLSQITETQHEIIQLLQRNDQRVIELIYTHYSHNLFNIIFRIVRDEAIAQDVFQESIIKIWRKGHYYNESKGSLYTWLVSVCKHAAIDKTRSREFKQAEKTDSENTTLVYGTAIGANGAAESENLHEMITKLPIHQRTIIDLSYFQGFTHEEIAAKLGIPEGTVKSRIRLAIKQLRKVIQA